MTETFSTKGLKALFSYPFRQPGWSQKLIILAGLILAGYILPILPWLAAAGYAAEIMRRTALGEGEPELPEWSDWGGLLTDGLRIAGVGVIFSIPLFIIFACGFGPYFTSLFAMISSGGDDRVTGMVLPFMMGSSMFIVVSMLCSFLYSCLIGIPLPAALAHAVVKRSFAAVFKISEWWKIFRANIGGFIIASLLVWVIAFTLQFVTQLLVSTFVLCLLAFIAPIVITPYVAVLSAYLYGQAYREGVETLVGSTAVDQKPDEVIDAEI